MSDSNDNSTIRPGGINNINNTNGGTIRPNGSAGAPSGNGGTIRPNSGGGAPAGNGGTIRPNGSGGAPVGNGGTIRPNSGGGAPAGNGGTIRPNSGGAPPGNGGTLRPNGATATPMTGEGKTVHQSKDDVQVAVSGAGAGASIAQADSKAVADVARTHEDFYRLGGGIVYKVKKVISESTGEAQVLLVENGGNEYVLKLYYPGISPNHAILEKVKGARSAGNMNFLVATVDHGVWCQADNKDRKDASAADRSVQRDYELMLYYPYGSMDKVDVRGNEKKLTEYFAKMAMGINQCHTKGFLHRDIKPANFLFSDKERTSVALGDFGIAVELGPNGFATTNQARTKVYAAPESYLATEGEVDITPKSDYFSLGMTLICLWMGEEQFAKQVSQSERALAKMKTYGKLPYPTNMSDHMLSLVMALTAPEPEARPDFAQISDWIRGKDPFLSFLKKEEVKNNPGIVFNGSKNLVAHSPEELAKFMMEDPKLGIAYLYSKDMRGWVKDTLRRPELWPDIEEITQKKYIKPSEKYAGMYAACLILDPEMPYTDVRGQQLSSSPEIADSLLSNFETYKQRLDNPTDELFVYMDVSGQESLVKKTQADFKNESISDNEALRRLIYQLDPTRPFIIKDEEGKNHLCNTPDDIIRLSSNYGFDLDSMRALYDEAFFSWLGARNKGLLAKVKKALSELPSKSTIRFVTVLYNLNPKVSYYMELDSSSSDYIFTHTQLAELFNHKLDDYAHEPKDSSRWKSADKMLDDINNIDDTLLYAYFKSKEGRYDQWIDWIRSCTNVKTKENMEKAGPYNWRLGTYKAIRGMGVTPYYRFPKSNKKITDPSELSQIPKAEIQEEMQDGMLADWLAVFYQEDPSIRYDQLPKFSYEQKCEAYTRELGNLDSTNEKYTDFIDAQKQVHKMAGQLRSTRVQLITMRAIVAVFCFVPIVGLIAMLLFNGLPWTENPMPGWSWSAIETMTLIFGVLVMFTGDVFDDGCISGVIAGLIGGFFCALIVYYALYFALAFIMPFASYIIIALLLLLAWYIYKSCYSKPSLNISQNKGLFNPGFEEEVLEPLDYAYNHRTASFDSSIHDDSEAYLKKLTDGRKKLFLRAIPTSIVTALLLFFFIQFTYGKDIFGLNFSFGGSDSVGIEEYERLKGQWNGTFDGRNATIDVYTVDDDGEMVAVIYVKYRSLLSEQILGSVNLESGEIYFDDVVSNDRLDGTYRGTLSDSGELMTISGIYTNKKSGKQVRFELSKSLESRDHAPNTYKLLGSGHGEPEASVGDASSDQSRQEQTEPEQTEPAKVEVPVKAEPEEQPAEETTGTGYTIEDAGSTGGGTGFSLEEVRPEDVPVDIQ